MLWVLFEFVHDNSYYIKHYACYTDMTWVNEMKLLFKLDSRGKIPINQQSVPQSPQEEEQQDLQQQDSQQGDDFLQQDLSQMLAQVFQQQ